MMYLDLNKGDMSLEKLCERFKLPSQKKEFDYGILKDTVLVSENYAKLCDYLKSDLDCTEELFKYYYTLFVGFRDFVSERDRDRLSWLTCSAGTTVSPAVSSPISSLIPN